MTATTGSELTVVDSSGWLEYITEDANAAGFAPFIEREEPLLIPTIVLYEVFKALIRKRGKTDANRFVSQAFKHILLPLNEDLALASAEVSLEYRLAMADAIVYATALAYQATLVTGDTAFRDLPNVIIP
ncbi:MAG: type II toxin-antitoxin system VapC family toxin [Candidatus Acidiferrales bacterium]